MDEIDVALSMVLMANSRTPYRELAEFFNMSVNSIHKRVKTMVDLGIIQNFHTHLSLLNFPTVVNVVIFGISKARDKKGSIEKLGKSEYIYNVTQASGNLFYIHAYIRNINELDLLVSNVRQIVQLEDLTVGLEKGSLQSDLSGTHKLSLSELDYLIINALKENSRKPLSDIASEIGVSAKTIRRHLDNLFEKSLVSFTIDWVPDKTGIIFSIIILKSKSTSKFENIDVIREKYTKRVIFAWAFSNLPNLILLLVWAPSMKEIQQIEAKLLSENFESVNVTILVEGKNFPTWRDTFLNEKIKELKKGD